MADGNLKFDTKIDTDGFNKGVNTLKNNFNSLKSTIKGTGKAVDDAFSGKTSSKVVDLNGKIEQTESQIKSLRAEMEKMASTPFVSKEADSLTKQVDKAEQQLLSLLNQREQLEEGMAKGIADLGLPMHGPETMQALYESNTEWQNLTDKISQAESKLIDYETKLKDVQQADAKVTSTGTEEYTKKEQQLQKLTNQLDVYKARLNEAVIAEQKKASSSNAASKATNRLSRSVKTASKSVASYSKRMAMFNRILLRFIMYRATRAVFDAIGEGMKNLVQVSPELNRNMSILKSSLTQLKNSLATAFAPILNIVAPILNSFIQMLIRATNAVAQFFAILGGKNTYKKAIEVQQDYAESLKKTGSQAKKTAKEVRKSLASIDEVNILNAGQDAGPGDGGVGGLTPDQMFDEVAVDTKFSDMINRFKKKIGELATVIKDSFTEGFESGLGEVNFDKIKKHAQGIKESIKGIFTDPDVQGAMTGWLKNVSFALGEITGSFAGIGLTIAELVLGSIDKYLSQNSDFIKEKLVSIFDIRGESAKIYSNFMVALADIFTVFRSDEAKQIGSDIIAIFTNSFLSIIELASMFGRDLMSAIALPITENTDVIKKALENTLKIVEDIVGSIRDFVENTFISIKSSYEKYIAPALEKFSSGFSTVFEAVLETYNKYFAPVMESLMKKIREVINGPVGDLVRSFMGLVGKLVDGVATIWNKTLAPFIAWLVKTFGPIASKEFRGLGEDGISMFETLVGVVSGIIKSLGGVIDFVVGIFTGDWRRAWNGIKAIFGGVWESLVSIVKRPINKIIDLVNGMLGGLQSGLNAVVRSLNKISVKIPNWVPFYGGDTFGINLRTVSMPRIPRLATGTVVPANYGEFVAILGDNKRETEVVSPLSTMKQAMKEALKESGSNNGGTTILKVYLEGKQIYQEVVRQNNQNTRRTGINALADA